MVAERYATTIGDRLLSVHNVGTRGRPFRPFDRVESYFSLFQGLPAVGNESKNLDNVRRTSASADQHHG